jgi:hypothetical protein
MSPSYVIQSLENVVDLRSNASFDELDYVAAFAWHNLHNAIVWWAPGSYDTGADFPTPMFEFLTRPTLRQLMPNSPLGIVGQWCVWAGSEQVRRMR